MRLSSPCTSRPSSPRARAGAVVAAVALAVGLAGPVQAAAPVGARASAAAAAPAPAAAPAATRAPLAALPARPPRVAGPAAPAPSVLRIAPGGRGRRDGSSWAHAGDLSDLPRFVAARPRGGRIWVRGDLGPYRTTNTTFLRSGGIAGSPVVVQGVDALGRTTVRPVIVGTRTAPYRPGGKRGKEVFELRRGVRHLVFSNLAFRNQGTAFVVAGDTAHVRVSDMTAVNVRTFFDNLRDKKEPSANMAYLKIERVTVRGFSKFAFRFRYNSSYAVVEDLFADSERQDRDNFTMGVALQGAAHHVVLRRVTMANAHDTRHAYWNGDGFATERGVHDVRFESTRASGNTDGGYDLKSTRTVLVNAVAVDNKRNFRFWSRDAQVHGCTAAHPLRRGGTGSSSQVWLSEDASVVLRDCRLVDSRDSSIAFNLEARATLVMHRGTVTRSPGSRLTLLEDKARAELPAHVT